MLVKRLLPVALVLVVLVAACSDKSDDSPTGPVAASDSASFSQTVRPILVQRCATSSCHGSAGGQGGLVFGSTNPSHATVLAVTSPHGDFVTPGSSATSNFYLKIIASVPNPPGGDRMPQGGPYLSSAQQNAVKRWIDNGALDN